MSLVYMYMTYDHYFQTSSLKPFGHSKPKFMWSLLERRGHKIIKKNDLGYMTKVAAMSIYSKNL